MKKYLVIGNPIKHSLSPELHNHWIKQNNLKAIYQKKQLNKNDLKKIIEELKDDVVHGINVTVPYKKLIIPYLDELSPLAEKSQSVNTILKKKNKIFGENTDIGGFQNALNHINYSIKNKRVFILGAGGVVPSIIIALKKLNVSKIFLSNRTKSKEKKKKKIEPNLEIVDWGQTTDFDMIINATSLGLKNDDKIKLDYNKIGTNKLFYDVIYNPTQTNFLSKANQLGNQIENGKMMFIYQAQLAFKIWHNILPNVTDNLLD